MRVDSERRNYMQSNKQKKKKIKIIYHLGDTLMMTNNY
jgi:uncharacterized membrane protein SirB2